MIINPTVYKILVAINHLIDVVIYLSTIWFLLLSRRYHRLNPDDRKKIWNMLFPPRKKHRRRRVKEPENATPTLPGIPPPSAPPVSVNGNKK